MNSGHLDQSGFRTDTTPNQRICGPLRYPVSDPRYHLHIPPIFHLLENPRLKASASTVRSGLDEPDWDVKKRRMKDGWNIGLKRCKPFSYCGR